MFKRLRRLNISLAAKCQLLFGAAVVLIIAAALFVPFQRMEQLMDQLNVAAASTLADTAVKQHVLEQVALRDGHLPPRQPATQPATVDGRLFVPPRLISPPADPESPDAIGRFERRAFRNFIDHPSMPYYARNYDGGDGRERYRFARPLYADQTCVQCHASKATDGVTTAATTGPTTAMAVSAARPSRLLGVVSVDIESQIETSQLLLNRVFLLTAGLLAGTLAIVVFYLITTRLILQPVRVLQETAEKVAEGNLNIRSDISTGDEFQQLSETFNTMLANLKESEDQLRAINQSLDLKLNQMAESNVALYESNRLKSEFLANVSHELRTPLNSILGFAELLRDNSGVQADAKSVRYIQNILSSGRNLLDLINDLLDLAKIEAGRMEVRSEPLSLPDLFEGLASILKPLTEQKDLTLDLSVDTDVPILHTDPAKLQQVLYNFLSNAIKFSPPGGRISLSAERESATSVRISVADQGPGIEPAKQAVIFEKFRQLDGSVTRQHSGTGLGLSISKELTSLLGGSIGVASTPGRGATFFINLPLKIQPGTQDVRKSLSLT